MNFVIETQLNGTLWICYPDMSHPARSATEEEVAMWSELQQTKAKLQQLEAEFVQLESELEQLRVDSRPKVPQVKKMVSPS